MEEIPFSSVPLNDTCAQDLARMERVKQGDMAAFEELIEEHQYRVIGTIARMLNDPAEAEDLAQQVFIRVWKSAPRYEPTARFTTWLYTITRNLVFNELRRRKHHPAISLDAEPDGEETAPRQIADASAKPANASLLENEMQAAIQKAIDQLPEVQRMAIILRRYDDLSYEEIAKILGLTVPSVKSVLFRARTELRERLKDYLQG